MTETPTYEKLRADRQKAWGEIYELKSQRKHARRLFATRAPCLVVGEGAPFVGQGAIDRQLDL